MHTEEEFSKKITFVSFVSALLVVLIHAYWVSLSYTLSDDFLYRIVIGIEKFINFLGNSYALTMFFAISSILFFRNVNDENLNGYYIVRNDDFIYNPRISVTAPVGPINRNRLGRNGVMSPLYTVFKVKGVCSEYLEWYFKSTRWHSFMRFNGDSGARSDRFSIKDPVFFEMPIPTPDIDEQKKIGEYFTNLDHLITLHQRKPFCIKRGL